MSRNQETTRSRDPVTGQYAFDGNSDRICTCGHRLGAHIAGGFECGTNSADHPETKGCRCKIFKQARPTQKITPVGHATEYLHNAHWWWTNFRQLILSVRHDEKSHRHLLSIVEDQIRKSPP